MEGKKRPLSEFATVSVKDGKDLVVNVYEESVSQTFIPLKESPLNMIHQNSQ